MRKIWILIGIAVASGILLLIYADRLSPDADPLFRLTLPVQGSGNGPAMHWYEKGLLHPRRGVALVIHGLNLEPERMAPLIRLLNRAGIDCLAVSLRGHGRNYPPREGVPAGEARLDAFRTVSYGLWSSEIDRAYREARARSDRKKTDLFLVGYSLGGLLGCDLLVSDPVARFTKLVLLAPALNVQAQAHLLRALAPFPNLVIDSLSPSGYRSNAGTPMAAYTALFAALDHFQSLAGPALNVPALVLIDPDDEFISAEALAELIAAQGLDRWTLKAVHKTPEAAGRYAHHLLIDEETTGREAWQGMETAIRDHLLKRTVQANPLQLLNEKRLPTSSAAASQLP